MNDESIFYDVSFLPNINLPRFTSRNLENHSLFDILRQNYQIKVVGGDQRIKALAADRTIQENLKVEKNTPVLHLQRRLETNRIDFNIYSMLYCDTREHELYGNF